MLSERAKGLLKGAAWRLAALGLMMLASGILCATLVRFAPGFGVDERELDSRLSANSVAELRAAHDAERHVSSFYWHYLSRLARGDLGSSHLFSTPIATLLQERAPVTARITGIGLVAAWVVTLSLALGLTALQQAWSNAAMSALVGALVSVPAMVVGLLVALARRPAACAVALVVFPTLYRYTRNILQRSFRAPYALAARARGVGTWRILSRHALPNAAPQLIALLGISVSLGFGAALPIEVVSDTPGVGALAWQAAIGRDLPLLITLAAMVTGLTMFANGGASLLGEALRPERA